MRHANGLLLASVAVFLGGCAALGPVGRGGGDGAADPPKEGCALGEKVTIAEGPGDVVTWGEPPLPPLGRLGREASAEDLRNAGYDASRPHLPESLKVQLRLLGDDGAFTFFSSAPTPTDSMIDSFLADGGVLVAQSPTEGQDIAEVVAATIGERATLIEVGDNTVVMNRSDPIGKGVRPFNVLWSDGEHDWRVMSGLPSATEALDVARSIVCKE